MTYDYETIMNAGYAVPDDLPGAVAAMSADLRSPDPGLRDGKAYAVLATWIGRGVLDAPAMAALGDEMAGRFADPEIQARTFAPLILDCVVSQGVLRPEWTAAFAAWFAAEEDLRGKDPELGWLHAVAHGADLLGTIAGHPEGDPVAMLELGAARLVAPTEFVWRDMEDERLSLALTRALVRPELSEAQATAWLAPVAALFAGRERIRPMPVVSNAMRTLRGVYVTVDRGPMGAGGEVPRVPHRAVVLDALADTMGVVWPFTG
ncbi:DUF2785 domain-containing protein [Actinorhabdospora filicis]|uniref:DUF2785 domain-containing protein n=1 Tax=Actinorhabdospora filicis TaxID=1785913 RepID=UPI002552728B|nr:DUF2785 domain-containing protein [Actinorhabdospora filicis]